MNQVALAATEVGPPAAPPHPREVRALRVRLGATMEALATAAGYQTRRSWWLVEKGKVELAPWRWRHVVEAAERGELARSGRAAGKTRQEVEVSVDELLWATEERRIEVAQAVTCLTQVFDVSMSVLAETSGLSHRMLSLILGGQARKQTTSARVAAIRAALLEMKVLAGEAMTVFSQEDRLSPGALRALRLGMRVSQERAGAWAAPSSVAPSALMSAYECGTVRMSTDAASRLADQLRKHSRFINEHPAWGVLETPAGVAVHKR